ncbi:MAG: hypothetical protein AAGA03_10000, partial [Planctomycetota bacterium]
NRLKRPEAERKTLQQINQQNSNSLETIRRLIQIDRQNNDWDQVAQHAEKVLAINPLLTEGHQQLADAAEKLDQPQAVIRALTALSELEPIDVAGLHYRLARTQADIGETDAATKNVLIALEGAPRYRDALRLLRGLNKPPPATFDETPTVSGESLSGLDEANTGSTEVPDGLPNASEASMNAEPGTSLTQTPERSEESAVADEPSDGPQASGGDE